MEGTISNLQSMNMFDSTILKEAPKYNLVLSDNSRYLEVEDLFVQKEHFSHIPTIKFDRTSNRSLIYNSYLDVNENRFKLMKEPEIWSKSKHVSRVSLSKGNKSVIVDSYYL